MSFEPNKKFLKKRKAIKQNYINNLMNYVSNIDEFLVEAFNNRESIALNGSKVTDFKSLDEVTAALNEINKKATLDSDAINNSSGYKIKDLSRLGNNLLQLGITKEQQRYLPVDLILKYEALFFLAGTAAEFDKNMDMYTLGFTEDNNAIGYMNDKKELEVEFLAEAKKIIVPVLSLIIDTAIAYEQLEKTVQDTSSGDGALRNAGQQVLIEAKNIDSQSLNSNEKRKLIQFLDATTNVIKSPTEENIKEYSQLIQEANNTDYDQSWCKKLVGAMLICLGIAMIALSIVAAVSTFGALSPLSLAGVIIGSAALTAVGEIALGSMIIDDARENNLGNAMNNLSKVSLFKLSLNNLKEDDTISNEAVNSNQAEAPKLN